MHIAAPRALTLPLCVPAQDNAFGPEGATALSPALKQLTGLMELSLDSKCVIGCRPWTTVCNDTRVVNTPDSVWGWGFGGVDMVTRDYTVVITVGGTCCNGCVTVTARVVVCACVCMLLGYDVGV